MTPQEKQVNPAEATTNKYMIPVPVNEKLADLKKRGYQLEFRREADCLYCIGLGYRITPDSFIIDEYYHFEDISNTDKDRTLYAISATQGFKGYLVDASFVYEDNVSPEMAQKLKMEYSYPENIMKNYDSLADTLDDLKKRGYDADFETQSNCLYCSDLDLRLYEEEFHVDEVYHFEGDFNPDDTAVVYALTSPTGVKGIIVDGSGASSNNISFDIAKKLQNHPVVARR